ncbi:hypothetical protein KM043_007900 [Ampulex compressa]|nr:hypothetical protein KM043_007900 [Ampulex compressa]
MEETKKAQRDDDSTAAQERLAYAAVCCEIWLLYNYAGRSVGDVLPLVPSQLQQCLGGSFTKDSENAGNCNAKDDDAAQPFGCRCLFHVLRDVLIGKLDG